MPRQFSLWGRGSAGLSAQGGGDVFSTTAMLMLAASFHAAVKTQLDMGNGAFRELHADLGTSSALAFSMKQLQLDPSGVPDD